MSNYDCCCPLPCKFKFTAAVLCHVSHLTTFLGNIYVTKGLQDQAQYK